MRGGVVLTRKRRVAGGPGSGRIPSSVVSRAASAWSPSATGPSGTTSGEAFAALQGPASSRHCTWAPDVLPTV